MSLSGQITVYPANRSEDLAVLLERVLALAPGGVLCPGIVVVQSQGMKHWLSLQLAELRGICMNLEFPMPGNFIWQLVRRLLGADRVPRESPYQREAMLWRIDRLLASPEVMADPLFEECNRYWRADDSRVDALKRFQLASSLADLYEQYLLFRPDWITEWDRGGASDNWQAALWRLLVEERPEHPLRLQQEAIRCMGDHQDRLPPQVCLFGINTLPPLVIGFFDQLARYTQVHLFHLNPCVEFWGNLQSDRQLAARQLREAQAGCWLAQPDPEELIDTTDQGNPLLANLGGQGREFFAALQKLESYQISAFDYEPAVPANGQSRHLLERLQDDILRLRDARKCPQVLIDDSVVFTSAHSALRELQGLHDWLLQQFQNDSTLKPQDVLVMCPRVEAYAPYVGAVFDTGSGIAGSEGRTPRLPCSVTDRSPLDSEPLVAAFLELLQLPDSRFRVSSVLDLLQLPVLRSRFGLQEEDLEVLEWWLYRAAIHWGLDSVHKSQLLGEASHSNTFSWSWGLRRLLLGFARSDQQHLWRGELLLPEVEDPQLLGRLMQLLERLQWHSREMRKERTPTEWGEYLRCLLQDFYRCNESGEREQLADLEQSIGQMLEWTELVQYRQPIPLAVIREVLERRLSRADGRNRFMTGQVTFCSMEPMRSAPFRLIAILGLNDGEYPRPQQPLGFDLMAAEPRRAGDRSRRGDDRYLFLEALICARDCLYLSYQGGDVRNNNPRQPSLVLKELMDYLAKGYGWRFEGPQSQLRRLPLHPFSLENYRPPLAGFDPHWFRLAQPAADAPSNHLRLEPPDEFPGQLELEELVRFFDNPPREFARQRLGLRLDEQEMLLDDVEPFEADGLVAYQARDELLAAQLDSEESEGEVIEQWRASGRLPDGIRADQQLLEWRQQAQLMAAALRERFGERFKGPEYQRFEVTIDDLRLVGELPLAELDGETSLLLCRAASIKTRDRFRLWLSLLLASAAGSGLRGNGLFLRKDEKSGQWAPDWVSLDYTQVASESSRKHLARILRAYRDGLNEPRPLNLRLLDRCFAGAKPPKDGYLASLEAGWTALWNPDNRWGPGLDPYLAWFWPQGARIEEWVDALEELYTPLLSAWLPVEGGLA